MKVFTKISQIKPSELKNVVVSVGNFDGVHIGHKVIIDKVVKDARKIEGKSLIITFKTHPVRILDSFTEPYLITSIPHKLKLIAERGVDFCYLIDFNEGFAEIEAEKFVKNILCQKLKIKKIITGFNFRFGQGQKGDNTLLKEMGENLGFKVIVIDKVSLGGKSPSSTMIRKAIHEANFNLIDELLGRRYSLWGEVVEGEKIGRTIGFPTANINPFHEIVPAQGVYAVKVKIENQDYQGVLNIGYPPFFVKEGNEKKLKIEVYILDFIDDIYGQEIEVFFIDKVRDEISFSDADELKEQIEKDLEKAKEIFDAYKQQKI